MDRGIKFRFWDKDLKKMFYRKPATNDFCHPKIIPMQFTGLTDKNGKEIFEGDKVTNGGVLNNCSKRTYVVFWNSDMARFSLKDESCNQTSSLSAYCVRSLEVIDNIHGETEVQNEK